MSSIWSIWFGVLLLEVQGSSVPSGKIYWTDAGSHAIRRADLDGGNVEDLILRDFGTHPRGLAIDNLGSKVYWTEMGSKMIMRASMDGTNVETVVTTYRGPDGLALDGAAGTIYWTDVEGRVQRMGIQGGFPEGIVEASFTHREGITVDTDGGWLYWPCVDRSYSTIHKSHLDGSGVTHLIDPDWSHIEEVPELELYGPRGIALDVEDGKVYWSDTITDKIQRSNLDGTDVEDIVTSGLTSVVGLAIDPARRKLYWADRGKNTLNSDLDAISRANLNGTDVEVLITNNGHAEPRNIALVL